MDFFLNVVFLLCSVFFSFLLFMAKPKNDFFIVAFIRYLPSRSKTIIFSPHLLLSFKSRERLNN